MGHGTNSSSWLKLSREVSSLSCLYVVPSVIELSSRLFCHFWLFVFPWCFAVLTTISCICKNFSLRSLRSLRSLSFLRSSRKGGNLGFPNFFSSSCCTTPSLPLILFMLVSHDWCCCCCCSYCCCVDVAVVVVVVVASVHVVDVFGCTLSYEYLGAPWNASPLSITALSPSLVFLVAVNSVVHWLCRQSRYVLSSDQQSQVNRAAHFRISIENPCHIYTAIYLDFFSSHGSYGDFPPPPTTALQLLS